MSIQEVNEENLKVADIGLWHQTSPPVIIPMSKRAMELMDLPEGADGAIFLCDANEWVDSVPDDFVVAALHADYHPGYIVIGQLAPLGELH